MWIIIHNLCSYFHIINSAFKKRKKLLLYLKLGLNYCRIGINQDLISDNVCVNSSHHSGVDLPFINC